MNKKMIEDIERSPNHVDVHVGRRIRDRRKEVHVTQEKLAEHLGLTFQQVQKYEKGANRVSASKLYEIARALNASIEYFFRGFDERSVAMPGVAEASDPFIHDFITTTEGQTLTNAFPKIRSPDVRRRVLELVKALSDAES